MTFYGGIYIVKAHKAINLLKSYIEKLSKRDKLCKFASLLLSGEYFCQEVSYTGYSFYIVLALHNYVTVPRCC